MHAMLKGGGDDLQREQGGGGGGWLDCHDTNMNATPMLSDLLIKYTFKYAVCS